MEKDKLLEYFGVKNHKELDEYIKNKPNDSKVKELKEILNYFNINEKEEN